MSATSRAITRISDEIKVSMDNNFDPLSDNKIDPPPCFMTPSMLSSCCLW
jgi:hypothetical protein